MRISTKLMKLQLSELFEKAPTITPFLHGVPGIGKSSIVKQVAQEHNAQLITVRLSELSPVDLRGLPVADHNNRITSFYPPDFVKEEGKGILFFDELPNAHPTMQGLAQQIILTRTQSGKTLGKDWMVVVAGNNLEDDAAVYSVPAPLQNRCAHYEMYLPIEDWVEYASNSGVHPDIISYLSYQPSRLYKYNKENPAWPSGRSWADIASPLHYLSLSVEPAVGEAAAREFEAWLEMKDRLPDVEAILDGKNIPFPKEISVQYLLISTSIEKAKNNLYKSKNLINYALSLDAEFTMLVITQIVKDDIGKKAILSLQNTDKYKAFSKKVGGII